MVWYVLDNGDIIHEDDVYLYKGKYYSRDDLEKQIEIDGLQLNNWGYERKEEPVEEP